MKQCYDWDKNILEFEDVNENRYCLEFKGNKTIVHGESATGKTLICTMLSNYIDDNNDIELKPYDANNIIIASKDNKDKINKQKKKLIIIDRAEFLLDTELIENINRDRGTNRYLIFGRKPMGIELSPNHFATLCNKDGVIKLEYAYDEKGWY